ncbi:DUF4350 domain-containing protein [Hymenobacter sp. GOD-10R]|uniref:DUF4350 domain-containing protein n=1 Tax=Hymenobacter sp. GOD-10R TaxID=3093922 RepID=UPI002D774E25|nr:DUF4350 domain-containing protein [Hymenobacter sp. GOD-10R]WRQ29845.1 DUF4350 domain-containing protein [Hymenobacter sp. GOD-10R]
MKNRRFQLYLLGLLVLFGAYVVAEYNQPKPVDRTPTFINHDKIPYGTYALFDLLPDLFKRPVQTVREPIFNQLYPGASPDNPSIDSSQTFTPNVNYCFVNSIFKLDSLDCNVLLRFVASGNNVFIAAEEFDAKLSDTLHFDTDTYARVRTLRNGMGVLRTDSVTLRFTPGGPTSQRRFRYPRQVAAAHFLLDSATTQPRVLAADTRNHPVLLHIPHGRGNFYLCSVPIAFTNLYVLRPQTSDFAFAGLSYLPAPRTIWWDEYQKQGRVGQQSLLRVVLRYPALRTAFYASLLGVVLFMAFEAKRRQRIIPVVKPLPNTTMLFTRTIASLYQQGNNHQLIAEKKISLFLEYIRTQFQEDTQNLADEQFRERLAHKTGLPRTRIDELVRLINFARTAPRVSDQELLVLSRRISDFRRDAR